MNQITRKPILHGAALLIVLVLLFTGLQIGLVRVNAAPKPRLSDSKMTICYGSIGTEREQYQLNTRYEPGYYLCVVEPAKGATYTFVSSNTKAVQIKILGNRVYLTGKAAGSSTITCKQRLKGKTTTIGTCKVTVNVTASSLIDREDYNNKNISMPIVVGVHEVFDIPFVIQYRNSTAKYTYISNSKNLSATENFKILTDSKTNSKEIYNSITYKAKKAGTYTVTVKETYLNKTRTVGSFKVRVDDAKYEDIIKMQQGEYIGYYSLFPALQNHPGTDLIFESDGVNLLKDGNSVQMSVTNTTSDITPAVTAKKPGITKINVFTYNSVTKRKGNLVASYLIIVTEPPEIVGKEIQLGDKEISTYVGVKDRPYLKWNIRADPLGTYVTRNMATLVSSDESVLKLKVSEYGAELFPQKAGNAAITVKYGSVSKTCKVTVYASEEEYLKSRNWVGTTLKMETSSVLYLSKFFIYPAIYFNPEINESCFLEGDGFDLNDSDSVVSSSGSEDFINLKLIANKPGTAKINVYEYDREAKAKSDFIGSFTVEVADKKDIVVEEIVLSSYTIETYVGLNKTDYFRWAVFPTTDTWEMHISSDSTNALWGVFDGSRELREKTSITYSDPSVISLIDWWRDDHDNQGYLQLVPKKAGNTKVTFQCDDVITSCQIIVYANKAEYQKAVLEHAR